MILALSVLLAHATSVFGTATGMNGAATTMTRESLNIFVWSGHAVFAFFILSGYYMAMVICQKYSKLEDGTKRFYFNRALRLYPTSWVILALYVFYFIASGTPSFMLLDSAPGKEWLTPFAIFSNVFFLGAELIPFKDPSNWDLVLGPIWSLSVEVYFYILAPFIVTRSIRFIALLALASGILRLTLYHFGVAVVPWRYFFFPSDLVFFLMGVIAYRLHEQVKDAAWMKLGEPLAAAALFGFIAYEPFWIYPDLDQWQCWVFFILVCVCTPFLFNLTKNSKLDTFIGQLAFPLYLGHQLVFSVVLRYYEGPLDKAVFSLAMTLALSIVIYFAIDKPLEAYRKRAWQAKPAPRPRLAYA
ncbi:acyltransferase [Chitinimonas arctica]|uniref:Acyltransferase n=1 Tax=Chitinimonas arctica TaxID=2594795 RepID=A0A516SIG5_9NEIS|nr:acyltransferase [Chitinimonas arctica]QDQ27936.1 acyltransferase [Chitinimonas arctica]